MKRSLESSSGLLTKKPRPAADNSSDVEVEVGSQSQSILPNRRNEQVISSRKALRFENRPTLLQDDVPSSLQMTKKSILTNRASSALVSKMAPNTNSFNNKTRYDAPKAAPNLRKATVNRKFEKPRSLPQHLPVSNSEGYPAIENMERNSVSMKNRLAYTVETLSTNATQIKPARLPVSTSGSPFEEMYMRLQKFPRIVLILLVCTCVLGTFWLQRKEHVRSLAATSVNNLSRSRAVEGLITGNDPIYQALPASQIMKLESELNKLSNEISKKRLVSGNPLGKSDSNELTYTPLVHASGNYRNPFELDKSHRLNNFSTWRHVNISINATNLSWNAFLELIDTSTETVDISVGDFVEGSMTSENAGNTRLYFPIIEEKELASSEFAFKPFKISFQPEVTERILDDTNCSILVSTSVARFVPFSLQTRRHTGAVSIKDFPVNFEPLDIEYSSPHWGATIFPHSHYDHSSSTALSAPFTSSAAMKGSRVSWVKKAGFSNVRESTDPNIVLHQRQLQSGECFAMTGSSGAITVTFPKVIVPTHFQLQHFISNRIINSTKQSSNASQFVSGSAPVNFTIYGWTESPSVHGPFFSQQVSAGRRLYLGTFQYDVVKASKGQAVQDFRLLPQVHDDVAVGVRAVTFFVQSNNGNKQFTCIYRMNVKGKRIIS
jgi:hypothetical protein